MITLNLYRISRGISVGKQQHGAAAYCWVAYCCWLWWWRRRAGSWTRCRSPGGCSSTRHRCNRAADSRDLEGNKQCWACILFKRTQRSCILLHSFQKNATFSRSFAFFKKNAAFFAFFYVLYKRTLHSLRSL